jgi:hypothetical protein
VHRCRGLPCGAGEEIVWRSRGIAYSVVLVEIWYLLVECSTTGDSVRLQTTTYRPTSALNLARGARRRRRRARAGGSRAAIAATISVRKLQRVFPSEILTRSLIRRADTFRLSVPAVSLEHPAVARSQHLNDGQCAIVCVSRRGHTLT